MAKWKTIKVTSGYGGNTRQPYVEINAEFLKAPLQIAPEEARDLAMNLLEAAEASEQDAFIFEFHSDLIDDPVSEKENIGASMLIEFRKWRDKYGQNK